MIFSRSLFTAVATAATLLVAVSASGDDGHGHGSGTAGFEWAGVFPGELLVSLEGVVEEVRDGLHLVPRNAARASCTQDERVCNEKQ